MNPTTKTLIDGIYMDIIPSQGACMDFGIVNSINNDPVSVFGALQWGLKREMFTNNELDEALGNGVALTELVNRGANPYGTKMVIITMWDNMTTPEEDEYYEEQEELRLYAEADEQEK